MSYTPALPSSDSASLEDGYDETTPAPFPFSGLDNGDQPAREWLGRAAKDGPMLLFIDDARQGNLQDGARLSKNLNELLGSLISSDVSVVVACREKLALTGITLFDVTDGGNLLDPHACRTVFTNSYFEAGARTKSSTLSDEELLEIDRVIADRAANHYMVIARFGAIASACGIADLAKTLDSHDNFRLVAGMNNQQVVDEIIKLYPIASLTEDQLSILGAFSVMPAMPLDKGVAQAWLASDANFMRIFAKPTLKPFLRVFLFLRNVVKMLFRVEVGFLQQHQAWTRMIVPCRCETWLEGLGLCLQVHRKRKRTTCTTSWVLP